MSHVSSAPIEKTSTSTSASTTALQQLDSSAQGHDDKSKDALTGLRYVQYEVAKEETYLGPIRAMISKDLSEPYSIYVYRYFLNQWPQLCFMVRPPFNFLSTPHPPI